VGLSELIQQGHTSAAFSLLEQNPGLADEPGAALLALYHGQSELAEAIIDQKSALTGFEAAAFGRVSELEGVEVDSVSEDGWQPLHLAAFFGHLEAVRFLLSKRASLDWLSENPLGVSPLHSALANKHEAIARELVFEGADVNLASRSGWTPLHYAAHQGNRALAQFLIENGATPTPGPEGKFPSDLAEEAGYKDLVEILA
jgi:ankyrin repeat protein